MIILAATNRPEILDPALLRPGRFDRQVLVDKPDLKGRIDILQIHAQDVRLDDSVDLEKVAREARRAFPAPTWRISSTKQRLLAVRAGRRPGLAQDFDDADRENGRGPREEEPADQSEERKIVAYHETGHALMAATRRAPIRFIRSPSSPAASGPGIYHPAPDRRPLSPDRGGAARQDRRPARGPRERASVLR